ncbi:uncharacterized protein KZ484_016726 [Pholidichthys leucotaenia]
MTCWSLLILLILLLYSAAASLPAPINPTVDSANFRHILRWDPGPGTPPGTNYTVSQRNRRHWKSIQSEPTNRTWSRLKLKKDVEYYYFRVQASHNDVLSPWSSQTKRFTPTSDTRIDPPQVSLTGHGHCLQVDVSLPKPDKSSGISDITKIYGDRFDVFWKKGKEGKAEGMLQDGKSFNISNLEKGVEYCVQVKLHTNQNTLISPSNWTCSFTSPVDQSRGRIIGAVIGVPVVLVAVVTLCLLVLTPTGIICKLKEAVPRTLLTPLILSSSTMTPEKTVPDHICVSSETGKRSTAVAPPAANRGTISEDEEEEDEDESKEYMDRGAGLSSGDSSHQGSRESLRNGGTASGGMRSPATEMEALPTGGEEGDGRGEELFGAQGGGVGEELNQEEEEVVVVEDTSENINLFSVTLASLATGGEEEEQRTDLISDVNPLITSDSQTESDGRTFVVLMEPTWEEQEEEDEEEEFSEYLRNR